jgi:hypothetical protein
MRYALRALLFAYLVALRSVGPILKSRLWRDGPQAIALLKLARGVAVSTGGAHAPEKLECEGDLGVDSKER